MAERPVSAWDWPRSLRVRYMGGGDRKARQPCRRILVALLVATGLVAGDETTAQVTGQDTGQVTGQNIAQGTPQDTPQNIPQNTGRDEAGSQLNPIGPLYRIGSGDVLRINVLDEPDLSLTVPVRPDGRISIPVVEDVDAAGQTPSQLADDIEMKLKEYLRVPSVTVEVLNAVGDLDQQIKVVGTAPGPEVAGEGPGAVEERFGVEPRGIPYRSGITLLDVITELGGLSPFAAGNRATIIRTVDGRRREIPVRLDDLIDEGDITANEPMAPGDVLLIPQGFASGDWFGELFGGAFVTFTDNVNLVPSDLADKALIFTLTPGVSIRGTTPRFYGGLDGTLNLAYQKVFGDNLFDTDEGFEAYIDPLLGTATVEAARDLLFIDAGLAISQQTGDLGEASSTSEFVTTNRRPTAAFNLSPYIPLRFGQYGSGQVRYRFEGSFEGDSDRNPFDAFIDRRDQSLINGLGGSVATGPETSAYGVWTLSSEVSNERRSDELSDINRSSIELNWAYPLTRQLFALAGLGWQYFDDGNPGNEINDPLFAIGTRWVPSPRLELTTTVGQQDARFNFFLDFRYDPTPRTNVFAVYQQGIGTTTSLIADATRFIQIDPLTGAFINSLTGATFDPTFAGSLSDETQFVRDFTFGARTQRGRDQFGVTGGYLSEEDEPDGEQEQTLRIFGDWSRSIRVDTTASLRVGFERDELRGRTDNIYLFTASLSHQFYDQFAAVMNYGFQKRDSTESAFKFTENVITVGVTGTF